MLLSLEHGRYGWDFIVRAEDGRSLLVQSDWEYPAIARLFGYSLKKVQPKVDEDNPPETNFGRPLLERDPKLEDCDHRSTDGTVDCPDCSVTASQFITAAHEWLSDNEGAEATDPGYFSEDT